MATNNVNGRINYTVGFNVDKRGLNNITQTLRQIQTMTVKDLINPSQFVNANQELAKVKQTAYEVEQALNRSFDTDLGTLNVSRFNQELKNLNINRIQTELSKVGIVGQNAFRNLTADVLTTNVQLKRSNEWLTKIGNTMANTIRWGITSSIWNTMTTSLSRAYGFAKSLDTSLNDIRIVTSKSADEMERFAITANKAAKDLGTKTTEYTNASLIYYQQGLGDEEVKARTETTLKTANVTGKNAATTSELLTAVWNGYKVNAEEAELYIDKVAAVATQTASDLGELSTGMSKVASAANLMGVDIDQLNAQLATVISVTKQAPESIGTAFKTIYARMGDIEAGLDEETTLGNYTQKMAEMGINVLDANNKLRDMGEVIEEIGGKWTSMSREQQIALSQTMAGARQYNNLLALFDNWGMYTDAIETSRDAMGTLQQQQDTYMESMQGHLQQLEAATEGVFNSLFNAEDFNPIIDILITITTLFDNFVQSIGGAGGAVQLLGNVFFNTMNTKIVDSIAIGIENLKKLRHQNEQFVAEQALVTQLGSIEGLNNEQTQRLINMKKEQLQYAELQTEEERAAGNEIIRQTNELYKQQDTINKNKQLLQDAFGRLGVESIDVNQFKNMSTDQLDAYISQAKTKLENFNTEVKTYMSVERFDKFLFGTDTDFSFNELLDRRLDKIREFNTQVQESKQLSEQTTSQQTQTLINQQEQQLVRLQLALKNAQSGANANPNSMRAQEAVARYKEQINILQEYINKLKDVKNVQLEAEEASAQFNSSFNFIKKFAESTELTREQSEELKKLIEIYNQFHTVNNNGEIVWINQEKALSALFNAYKLIKDISPQVADELKKVINTARKTANEEQKIANETERLANNQTRLIDSGKLKEQINQVTNAARVVNQLSFAISSIQRIPNIWEDENLTTGEKLLQTVMALSMSIPNLASSFQSLTSFTIKKKVATDQDTASIIANTEAETARQAIITNLTPLEERRVASVARMTTVRNLDIAAMSTEQAVTEISNLAKQRGTILTQKEAEAVYSHILALRGQTVATNAATVAQEGLNTAMSINPIGIILVALTALITTIALYTSNLEKVRKQKIENAKADLEELKNTRNEIRENEKLLQSYDNLYYKFKQNEATKEELQIQTEQLLEKYDNEIDKIALLAENYDKLEESIRAARLTELEKEEINVNDQIKDTNLLIQEQQRKTGVTQGYSLFIPEGITTLQQFDASGSTETLKRNDLSEQDVLNRIKDKNAYYWNVNTGFSTKDDEFFKEELLRSGFFDIAVQDVGNAKFYFKPELVTDEETYVQTLKSLEEYVNKIKEEYKDLGQDDSEIVIGLENLLSIDSDVIDQAAERYADRFKIQLAKYLTETSENELDVSAFKKLYEDILVKYEGKLDENEIRDEFSESYTGGDPLLTKMDLSNRIKDELALTEQQVQKLDVTLTEASNNSLRIFSQYQEEYTQFSQDLTEETKQKLGDFTIDMMSELKNIDDAINQVANAQQLIDFLDTDKKLTTKELEEQNSLIKSLEQEYNTLANIENKQSEYYLKTLEEILDREEEREKTAKENAYLLASQYSNTIAQDYIDQLQDLSEKTDEESLKAASALRKNLTLAIEEVGTTAREYSQSLTDDLLSDMASIVRKNINMADAVAAIKDGFKIESDDLETVFSAFPELAMDATVLKNGLLQLNSDVVEAVLGGQAEILDGERELALFKTQERLKELKEEIEQQQQIIEEARAVNGDKTKLINLLNKVYDKNTNIQIKRTAKESEVRIENDNNVTQQVIQNWQKMQRAAITYSQTAQAAMAGKFDEASQVSRIQDYITDEVEIKNKIDFEISDFDSTEIDNQAKQIAQEAEKTLKQKKQEYADLMISATEMYATTNDIQKAASKSTEKTNEFLKNQIDRYHDINVELQKVTNTLERLSLVESRMIGNSLIKNLQKQTNELQKQIKLSKEKQKLQYDEARELKGRLKGYGTTFEENTITNYAEILKQYQDAHNALAISGGSDKQIEAAKKTYENLKEDIEKYEQLVLEDIPNLYDEMLEDEYERMEKQIQMYNEQMQIKLDAKEAIRDLNVWASEVFDEFKLFNDDIAHAVDGFKIVVDRSNRSMQNVDSYYNAADSGTAELDLEKFNHIIENVALMNQKDIRSDYASTDQYGNIILNQTKAIEDLDAAEEALKTSMNDLLQEANNVIEAWNDGFDAYLTKTDELIDVFDEAIRQLNHAAKVNELLYGKSAKASVTFTQGQIDQNNQKLLAMNIQRGELESEYKRLLADGNDTQARVVKESYDKLVSDMDSIVEDNLQLIQENITNRVNAYYEDLQASTLTQGEWDMSKTSHENRYDRNQQQLKLDAFDAKIEADKAGMDAKTQARLQKFQNEELKRLREKDVLTKHEYERAEKRYELLLKQIALEESQNNKTKMRLRRDSQGNYSYQYVADDEDVDDKKEEIASKKEEIYTFDRDYLTDMTDALQKMLTENGADLAKMILAYQQAGRTPEAYSQLQAYLEQLTKNYGLTVDDFLNAKNFLIDDLRDIYPDTSSLIDQNGFDVNTIASLIGGTAGDIQNMDVNTLLNALQTAQGGSNYLLETIYGINGEIFNVSDAIANAVQTGYFDVSSLGDLTTEILAKADTDINTTLTNGHQNLELINGDLSSIYDMTAGIAEQVAAVTAEWANVALELENNLTAIQNIIDKINSELILAIQDAIATAAKLKQEAASIEWSEPNYSGIGEAGTDSSGITSSTGGLGSDSSSSAVSTTGSKNLTFWQWLRGMSDFTDSMDGTLTHAIDNYASKSHMTPGARDSMKDNPNESMKRIYEQDKKNGFMMYKDISGFNPGEATKFATGGYTGNDEGLAMLHKKELVLNAEDTENMLKMLEIVRNMKNSVLEQQQTNSLSFDNFANKMLSFLNEASTVKLNKSTSVPGRSLSENENSNFQQTVNITAEFPNVTNRNEIELALQNLSSVAAQSAFSTRR